MLDEIRDACAWVAAQASRVHIDHDRLTGYAGGLVSPDDAPPEHDPATHWLGHGDDTLAFFLVLDAVNFGSGWFPVLDKRPGLSGYFTVAAALTDHFATRGVPSPADLESLDKADCASMFGQDREGPAAPLMALFGRALNDLGSFIAYHGGYRAVVGAANSAEMLAESLSAMPLFADRWEYRGRSVPFYKRAQITPADLHIAGVATFDDLHRLTIFADNLVPHVLRVDGVLVYDGDLAAHIDRGELIEPGSPDEVEIRACALHAVEILSDRTGVPAHRLDYTLWNRGQAARYKAIPRHRARTVSY